MLDFIMIMFAVYLAIVAAATTILILATSKWYIKKCTQMTKDMTKEMFSAFPDEY